MCCSPVVHEHILESQPRPIHLPSPPTPRHLTHRSQPSQVQSTHLSPSHPTRKEKRKKEKEEKREKEKGKKKKGRRKTFLRRGFLFRSPIYKDARAFKSFLRAFPLPPRLAFITKKRCVFPEQCAHCAHCSLSCFGILKQSDLSRVRVLKQLWVASLQKKVLSYSARSLSCFVRILGSRMWHIRFPPLLCTHSTQSG